jgi:hypothetical protein
MRTVVALTDAIAISTGLPAITIGADWPRSSAGASAKPAPAEPIALRALRLVTGMGAL